MVVFPGSTNDTSHKVLYTLKFSYISITSIGPDVEQ
jgi:hypothetical protein